MKGPAALRGFLHSAEASWITATLQHSCCTIYVLLALPILYYPPSVSAEDPGGPVRSLQAAVNDSVTEK
jgi:hypothetical protein